MRVRIGVIVLFFIVVSGCVENQFTGGDLARCLEAAQAGVNRVPACGDGRSCQAEWESYSEMGANEDFVTQTHLFRAQKEIVATWVALNQVESATREVQKACESGNVVSVFSYGVQVATRIKNALQASEKAELNVQAAMTAAAEYGSRLELENVRDTAAFEGYSRVLESVQEWQAGVGTHAETQSETASNAYWTHVAAVIGENDLQSYQPVWGNAFSMYKTLMKAENSSAGGLLLIFSPVWQSGLSALSSESRVQHALSLAEQVNVGEMVNHLEEKMAPEGGIIFRWLARVKVMEEGVVALRIEEQTIENELKETRARVAEKESETILSAKWDLLHMQRVENRSTLGARVAAWRELKKEMGAEEARIVQREIENERLVIQEEKVGSRVRLVQCVDAWTKYGIALELGVDSEDAAYFEREFGVEAGRAACEAALLSRKNEYNSLEDVQAWNALTREAMEKDVAWTYAQNIHPEWVENQSENAFLSSHEYWAREDNPLTSSERSKRIEMLEKSLDELNMEFDSIIQNEWNTLAWSVDTPDLVEVDREMVFRMHLEGENPFGRGISRAGTYRIPVPVTLTSVESNPFSSIERGERGVVWMPEEIPFPGIRFTGEGAGTLVTSQKSVKVERVTSTRAYLRETITLASGVSNIHVVWKWIPTHEMEDSSVHVMNENHEIPFQHVENGIRVTEFIDHFPVTRSVVYEDSRAVEMNVELETIQTSGGETVSTYRVDVQSMLDEPIATSLSTGITGDPVNTLSVLAVGEGGEPFPTTRNPVWGVILPNVELAPHQTKRVFITLRVREGLGDWRAWAQTIVDEATNLKENGSLPIALRAGSFIAEIQAGWNERSVDEWARLLPAWQADVEKLRTDMEMEEAAWAQGEAQWSEIKEKLEKNSEWKNNTSVNRWVQQGMNAKRDHNWLRFSDAVQQLEKWVQNQELMTNGNQLVLVGGEEVVSLEEVHARVLAWKEKWNEYSIARALSCEKLAELGFMCPVSADAEKAGVKNVKDVLALVSKDLKKWETKSGEERSGWENERSAQWNEWKKSAEEGSVMVDEGISALRDTASALMDEMSTHTNDGDPNVQSAIAKAQTALDQKEFGKVIFIGKNLRAYWQEHAPFTGLSTIPLMGWPLLGMIMIIGGSWAYRKWRPEKKAEIIPITIPRARKKEISLLTEESFARDDYPHTQEVNRAAWRASTRSRIQSRRAR